MTKTLTALATLAFLAAAPLSAQTAGEPAAGAGLGGLTAASVAPFAIATIVISIAVLDDDGNETGATTTTTTTSTAAA